MDIFTVHCLHQGIIITWTARSDILLRYQITLKYAIYSYFWSLAPAREAVKYEIVETNTTIDSSNVYMGKPRPEQTLAWEEITKCRLQRPFQKIPEMLMNYQTLREKYRSI